MGQSQKTLVGLDIGGTKIEAVLWRGGKVLEDRKRKTPKTRARFFRALFEIINQVRGSRKLLGIGIGMAGALDLKRGRILRSPNLKFLNGVPLRNILEKRYKVPVRVDNDANCFLRGEWRFGQGRGKRNLVALTLGTGVGGAVVADGWLLQGRQATAGELGHMVMALERNRFLNLEDLVSSYGFRRLGVRDPLLCQNKALAGDRRCQRIYEEIGRYLGAGLASLVNIFDPELILLGGGIARARGLLTRPAAKEMLKHTLRSLKRLPPIKVSRLKFAGALGAVSLFLKK